MAGLIEEHGLSERRACAVVGISRSVSRYSPRPDRDEEVIAVLLELSETCPERGFSKLYELIRRRGLPWNHKRVWRVYCDLKLNLRRKGKKGLPKREPQPLAVPEAVNATWSADFMSDALWDGRRFRTFNLVDDFNREALADWAVENGVELEFIQPGRPMQNGFIERFNGSYRRGVLDMYVFRTLNEVREHTERWRRDYNEQIPHESLNDMTPVEYRQIHQPETSSIAWT